MRLRLTDLGSVFFGFSMRRVAPPMKALADFLLFCGKFARAFSVPREALAKWGDGRKGVKNMEIFKYLSNYSTAEILGVLPTVSELEAHFPHKSGCGGNLPLTAVSDFVFVESGDPRVGSIGVRSYFLRCDECHVQREYRAK